MQLIRRHINYSLFTYMNKSIGHTTIERKEKAKVGVDNLVYRSSYFFACIFSANILLLWLRKSLKEYLSTRWEGWTERKMRGKEREGWRTVTEHYYARRLCYLASNEVTRCPSLPGSRRGNTAVFPRSSQAHFGRCVYMQVVVWAHR